MTDLLGRAYQPKVGDRVRVVHEGVVDFVSGSGYFEMKTENDGRVGTRPFTAKSIEKLPDPPLPTTTGSIIERKSDGVVFVRTGDVWRMADNPMIDAWSYLEPSLFKVTFVACEA